MLGETPHPTEESVEITLALIVPLLVDIRLSDNELGAGTPAAAMTTNEDCQLI